MVQSNVASFPRGEDALDKQDSFTTVEAVRESGIGYGGLEGITWRMMGRGERSISLPRYVIDRFTHVAQALSAFITVLHHAKDAEVHELLSFRKPERVTNLVGRKPMRLFRPDVVLTEAADGNFSFRITEIESAPGGLGMFEAVRQAYQHDVGSQSILAQLRRVIGTRPFVVVMNHRWVDYLWDICTACKCLREQGVDVRVIVDRSFTDLEAYASREWQERQAEMPAHTSQLQNWNPHLRQRLEQYGFRDFLECHAELPEKIDGAPVVFRMGYHGSFRDRDTLERMSRWERNNGATILNGLHYGFESKAMLAALQLPSIRDQLSSSIRLDILALLDQHVAPTYALNPRFSDLNHLCAMHQNGVLKVAAWDEGDHLSWGARGLTVGQDCTYTQWVQALGSALAATHPSVVQQRVKSVRRNFNETVNSSGEMHNLKRACMRWTPFVLVDDEGCVRIDPGVITALNGFAAHGAADAVMAPVVIEE